MAVSEDVRSSHDYGVYTRGAAEGVEIVEDIGGVSVDDNARAIGRDFMNVAKGRKNTESFIEVDDFIGNFFVVWDGGKETGIGSSKPEAHARQAGVTVNYVVSILKAPRNRVEDADPVRVLNMLRCPTEVRADGAVGVNFLLGFIFPRDFGVEVVQGEAEKWVDVTSIC